MTRVDGSSVQVVDKEVTSLADLSEGDVRRGFVVSAGSIGVLVRLATQLTLYSPSGQCPSSHLVFQM